MADYAIGDLQGCFEEFSRLLKRVDFNPSKDHLYLVGDIVARGPDSLACLDYIYRHQDSMSVTLGNHDLHMIACHYLNKPINPKDKLDAIFNSKKLPHYIAYLQTQPLALYLAQHRSFISHAGLNPDWSIKTALKHAQFAKRCYQSANAAHFFKKMYQPHPTLWDDDLNDFDKFRYIVNYFTRMRFLTSNNTLELNAKGAINDNKSLTAWFEHPNIKALEKNLIFGHWAALEGVTQLSHVHALDTGCVWGGALTMMDLQTKQKIVEKPAHLPK